MLLWALHEFVGLPLSQHLSAHGRTAGLVVAGLAGLLCVYAVLAFNVTGGYALSPGETLRRSVYPAPGDYTLEGDWSGGVQLTVESQNKTETIMHTSTVLYSGPLDGAAFTVPEDSTVVYLDLSAQDGAALERLSLSGGPSVKLGYRLLPGFAANRLQGLWANQNAIQRTEFFRDGLRIYAQSPVIGNGLGSVEGLVTSVQSFYYESKYVHNHYIQVLAEMGIPGLLAFLAILGSAAVTLWKRRREGEEDALLPALCACLAMAALHAAAEAVWSLGQYQTMALLVLAMIAVCFGRPVTRLTSKTAALASSALLCLFSAVFAWLLYGNLTAERAYAEIQAGTRIQDAYSMTNLARRDRYGLGPIQAGYGRQRRQLSRGGIRPDRCKLCPGTAASCGSTPSTSAWNGTSICPRGGMRSSSPPPGRASLKKPPCPGHGRRNSPSMKRPFAATPRGSWTTSSGSPIRSSRPSR